jgi:DNA-binding transcriptional LysR family regulator
MAREQVAQGALVRLFEDWQLAPMPLYVAYPPNRHVGARLRVFIDWVAQWRPGSDARSGQQVLVKRAVGSSGWAI